MSKVLIKTLQQKTFEIEIDHSETVRALKEKIESTKGEEFQADLLKLIYSGKILDDTQPLTKYKIQPNGFVVVMVSKSRPPPKPAAEEESGASETSAPESSATTQETTPTPDVTETSQPQQTTATTSEGTSRMDTTEATPTVATPAATPTAVGLDTTDSRGDGTLQQADSALLTGQNLDAAVMTLMEFGYEQELVTRALNASFNNPDRAAEMLMSYHQILQLPQEHMEEEPGEQPTRDTPPQQPSGSAPASGENPFEFLRQRPQFQLLQTMIRDNPQALPQLLQQLGQSNPQLLQLINANQQEFINMLNSPPSGSSAAPPAPSESAGGPPVPRGLPQGMPQGIPPGMVPPGMLPPGAVSIQVTPEEKAAIDRLKALGFPETDVIQAYMACDKNEELAANFLLSDRD